MTTGSNVGDASCRQRFRGVEFSPSSSWALCTAFTLALRKLGAIRGERVNELAVVLEQRRCRDAGLLRQPRKVHASRERERYICMLRRVELPQPDADPTLRAAE